MKNKQQLTRGGERIAAEQDAETRLEIESPASVVGAASLDTIAELERVGSRLQDLFGRGEHESRHELEGRVLGRALDRRLAGLRARVAEEKQDERRDEDDRRHAAGFTRESLRCKSRSTLNNLQVSCAKVLPLESWYAFRRMVFVTEAASESTFAFYDDARPSSARLEASNREGGPTPYRTGGKCAEKSPLFLAQL